MPFRNGLNIGIIDDELPNRLLIRRMLESNYPLMRITVDEGSINAAIEALNDRQPDLVFLDIRLKNGTGFDIVEKLQYKPKIIFTTAYSEYVLKAFKVQAVDYLLKPIDEAEFIESMKKLERLMARQAAQPQMFHYNLAGDLHHIPYDDILYFESKENRTQLVTENEAIALEASIDCIERELPDTKFYRTHSDYIVNLKKVRSIDVKREGQINLSNDRTIPVSQKKLPGLLDLIRLTNVS